MLEPISTEMINHHSLDLKRFQQEKFEEHLYSIANHLRHPDGWNTSLSRISTPPPNRRSDSLGRPPGTPPTDPASINRYAGLKVKRDTEHRHISDNSGSIRKPGSPWTDLRSQGRMKYDCDGGVQETSLEKQKIRFAGGGYRPPHLTNKKVNKKSDARRRPVTPIPAIPSCHFRARYNQVPCFSCMCACVCACVRASMQINY